MGGWVGWVAHQSTCWTGSRCNWLARSAGQRTQYSVFSWTQRERRWGRDGGRREGERERDLEREERWRDLGGSVCLPAVSLLLLLLLYVCHNFSETHLVSFGGVLLFFFSVPVWHLFIEPGGNLSISLSKSAQLGGCSYCPM